MKFLVLIILLFSQINAQTIEDWLGEWQGVAYQNPGGIATEYNYKLNLVEDRTKIKGTSFISMLNDNTIFGVWSLIAEYKGGKLHIKELEITDSKIYSWANWCVKDYTLTMVKKDSIYTANGPWTGVAEGSVCRPGSIAISRKVKKTAKEIEISKPKDFNENDLSKIKKNDILVLKNITFKPNSSDLNSDSYVELNKVVSYLNKYKQIKARVNGHTDIGSTFEFNEKLSVSRAQIIYNYFVLKGVDKSRLSFVGWGNTKPISTNDTSEGRALNRRCEIEILAD